MKKIILLLLLCGTVSAQKTLNDYKYAVVPKKFDFLDEADKYLVNTYVKMYMEKYGFTTYFKDDVPMELANENCNKVFVDLKDNSSTMMTKVTVEIRDCTNKVLFTSVEGKSRIKQYKAAYAAALREAFASFDSVNYKYNGNSHSNVNTVQISVPTPTPATPVTTLASNSADSTLLFAQPIPNGFQLVDTTPKVILKLQSTSMPGVFIAERDNLKGVLLLQNGKWVFEYYSADKLFSEPINVRF